MAKPSSTKDPVETVISGDPDLSEGMAVLVFPKEQYAQMVASASKLNMTVPQAIKHLLIEIGRASCRERV